MDWQQIVSLALVALSAILLTRRLLHARKRSSTPCGHSCTLVDLGDGRRTHVALNVDRQNNILGTHSTAGPAT
jgi:hypothetical protein